MTPIVPGISVLTDSSGFFVVSGLNPGDYTLIGQKEGYVGSSVIVTAASGQISTAGNLLLDLNSQSGIVSGLIQDSHDLSVIANAQVSLNGVNSYSILTDGQGFFELLSVTPDNYSISIQKAGYYAVSGNVTVISGQTRSIDQKLIREGAFLDTTPVDLSAVIIDAISGEALARADFLLDNVASAQSDNSGKILIPNVARGSYQGQVKLAGYRTINVSILLNPGANGDLGQLSLYPVDGTVAADHLTLFAKIVDGVTSEAIPNATVQRIDSGETWTSDDSGNFIADNITALELQLKISAPDYDTRIYTLTVSAFGEVKQTFVLPPAGDDSLSQSHFSGAVNDLNTGELVVGAQVAIDGADFSAVTDSHGEFLLTGVKLTEFTFNVSMPGYRNLVRTVQISAHGNYRIDFNLEPIDDDASALLQIISLSQPQLPEGANSVHLFNAQVSNLTEEPQEALITGEIFNADGESVAVVAPYLPGTTEQQNHFDFLPEETIELTVPWKTAQLPPGTYRLALRVVKSGSITQSLPTGVIIDEFNAYGDIEQTASFDGTLGITPPLSQVGSQTPVILDVLILNNGNIAFENSEFKLTITDPETNTTVHSATARVQELGVSNNILLSFGSWIPSVQGNAPITVQATSAAIAGEISGIYYIGDKATGAFTLDKTVVPEGDQTVRGTISLEGVDTAQGSAIDPLVFAVRNAVSTGADYTATEAIGWQHRNRCLGCHIQTQSMVGVTSAFQKNLGNEFDSNTLFNILASSQQDDGGLRSNHPSHTRTETALGVWALTSWNDTQSSFRTLYKAGKHMFDLRSQSGDRTWWQPSHRTGWWYSDESHTAMTVKAFAKLLREAEKIDLTTINDYRLSKLNGFGAGSTPLDMEFAQDGFLYTIKRSGHIVRTDPQTGISETFVSGLPIIGYGFAMDDDGGIYLSGYEGKLLRRNSDGSIETLLSGGGYLTDVDIGPDGLLYVADYSQNRILRVTLEGQVEVLASGGLLQRPYGIDFDSDGNLYIANLSGYNILKLDTANKLTVFADGLAYPPLYIVRDPSGGFYYTSNVFSSAGQNTPGGINHLSATGVIERLYSKNRLFGVVASSDHVFTGNLSDNSLYELSEIQLNTALLPTLLNQTQRAANYFLSRYRDGTSDNIVQACV